MYRQCAEITRKAKIHKLMNNGHRFGVMMNGAIIYSCRHEYEASRRYPKKNIIPLMSLI